MRKIIVVSLILVLTGCSKGIVVPSTQNKYSSEVSIRKVENVSEAKENEVVYNFVKADFILNFELAKVVENKGELQEYAKALLDIDNSITETKTTYHITNITTVEKTSPDKSFCFAIKSIKDSVPVFADIDKEGFLVALNKFSAEQEVVEPSSILAEQKNKLIEDQKDFSLKEKPLFKDYLKQSSVSQKATFAANLIYNTRLRTYELIFGSEDEKKDATSYKQLEDFSKTFEANCIRLFKGEKKTEFKTISIKYSPKQSKAVDTIAYYNVNSGISRVFTPNSLPITIEIEEKQLSKIRFNELKNTIYYRQPYNVNAVIKLNNRIIATPNISIPQFGEVKTVPFLNGRNLIVEFDKKTGGLKSIVERY